MNTPAERTGEQLILEGIVTTIAADGSVNIAPMGPVVDRTMKSLRLRPFNTSVTYRNLASTGRGVFHVTDDSLLLATAALGCPQPRPTLEKLTDFDGYVITDACRWYAFEVIELDDSQQRVEIECRTVDCGDLRPFLGWNRATHSVLEAAILATRVGLLPDHDIQPQLDPLRVIVEKTASDRERRAFQFIEDFVAKNR